MSLTKVKAARGRKVCGFLVTNVPLFLTYALAVGGTLSQSIQMKRFDKEELRQESYVGEAWKNENILVGE